MKQVAAIALVVGALLITLPGATAAAGQEGGRVTLVDLMPLREGADPAEVNAYMAKVSPIFAKHDLQFVSGYVVKRVVAGQIRPHFVFVYTVPSLETVQAILTDPEYTPNIPTRDRLFDFSGFISLEVGPLPAGPSGAQG